MLQPGFVLLTWGWTLAKNIFFPPWRSEGFFFIHGLSLVQFIGFLGSQSKCYFEIINLFVTAPLPGDQEETMGHRPSGL